MLILAKRGVTKFPRYLRYTHKAPTSKTQSNARRRLLGTCKRMIARAGTTSIEQSTSMPRTSSRRNESHWFPQVASMSLFHCAERGRQIKLRSRTEANPCRAESEMADIMTIFGHPKMPNRRLSSRQADIRMIALDSDHRASCTMMDFIQVSIGTKNQTASTDLGKSINLTWREVALMLRLSFNQDGISVLRHENERCDERCKVQPVACIHSLLHETCNGCGRNDGQ